MNEWTTHLKLPFLAAAQAQKHVTHNEALALVDLVVQLAVVSDSVSAPPADPVEGDRYIVPAGATGAFAGHEQKIAAFDGGVWRFLAPVEGWAAWVQSLGAMRVYSSGGWIGFSSVAGLGVDSATGGAALQQEATVLSESVHKAQSQFVTVDELIALSGSYTDSTLHIPSRAIVFCVSTRVTEAITGATSYDCGILGETSKFGGSLGVTADSNNAGVIGPTAFYADTSVRITANGGAFTGGILRLSLHYFLPIVPQS
ncbi:DUF2793 domain-containing protein [Pseudovibrio brasiliensis]|uniref:DUF2793 domain-containing protein n=1 Tax=Pseudovibrio brasiliensis TaxID=1898042 RepID=A0ABX8AGS3_9HYPH|nr:DUF2793 domain-containing protein [Pseudovibrio brasiliensis]QUS54244.1 DUF2793 domain-containing protein [Pseudovibrio brasiliensis]